MSAGSSVIKAGSALAKTGTSAVSAGNSTAKAGNCIMKSGSARNSLVKSESETGFKCRQTFEIHKEKLNFHPGHMAKGEIQVQAYIAFTGIVNNVYRK